MDWALEAYLAERLETLHADIATFHRLGQPDRIEWHPDAGSLELCFADGGSAVFASTSTNCEQVAAMAKLGQVLCRARVREDGRLELIARLQHWEYQVVAEAVLVR